MMPARRDRPVDVGGRLRRLFQRASHRLFDEPRGERRHIERRDHPAQGGVAPIARQRGDDLRRDRGIELGEDVGRSRRALRHQERNDRAFGRLRQRLPYVDLIGFSGLHAQNVGDLFRRQSIGEQVLGLAGVAEQIGAGGEVGRKFVDQPIQSRRRDGAEPGRGPRHRLQVGLIELLEQPRGRRLAHHQQQGARPSRAR